MQIKNSKDIIYANFWKIIISMDSNLITLIINSTAPVNSAVASGVHNVVELV